VIIVKSSETNLLDISETDRSSFVLDSQMGGFIFSYVYSRGGDEVAV